MQYEEELKHQLLTKFAFLDGKVAIVRPRRISVAVEQGNFGEVLIM